MCLGLVFDFSRASLKLEFMIVPIVLRWIENLVYVHVIDF